MKFRSRARAIACVVPAILAIAACGTTSGTDGGGEVGSGACGDAARVELQCPAMVDPGCVPTGGAPLRVDLRVTSCEDSAPTVRCTPDIGSMILPGTAGEGTCTAMTRAGAAAMCRFAWRALDVGAVPIVCEPMVGASCSGVRTRVDVPAPRVDTMCGMVASGPTSDAPADGFPVGDTAVTFRVTGTSGQTGTCATTVRVTDTEPPMVMCPTATRIARATAGEAVSVPEATAVDRCDPSPRVVATPTTLLTRGVQSVRYVATDAARRLSECSASITVVDAFAVTGLRVIAARLVGASETSITIAWEPSAGQDATGYRLERAPDAAGPWFAVAQVGAMATEATDPRIDVARAHYRVVTLAGELDGGISPTAQAHAVRPALYDLRSQPVPTVAFPTTLYGVVRQPADLSAGPYPLVLLLHGNHGNCRPASAAMDDGCSTTNDHDCHASGYTTTPNAEGLVYLAETLAANGYIAVTLSGNALNCRDDYILERSQLIIEHLRRWRAWNEVGAAPFGNAYMGTVAMHRVGLVGHSRGGEAVAHVPGLLRRSSERAITVRSVFSVAPTDYHDPIASGAAYGVLIPACDGDVANLDGINIYDRTVDATDTSPSTQVFYVGANHNYFSTEWRFDDNRLRRTCDSAMLIGTRAQQGMLEATLVSWFTGSMGTTVALEPFVTADGPLPRAIVGHAQSNIDLRWSFSSAASTLIDDFEGASAPTANRLMQSNTFAGFGVSSLCRRTTCDTAFPHLVSGVILDWSAPASLATLQLGRLDATGASSLSFRVASRSSALNAGRADQDVTLRVVDGAGARAQFRMSELQRVPHSYPTRNPRTVLQTVHIPLARVVAITPAFDTASIARLELETSAPGYSTGSLVVTDVELVR